MLGKDNIISISVLEAVEKIPKDEKYYHKCSFICFTLHSHTIERADQHIANMATIFYLLGNSCAYSVAEKIAGNILHKSYTEKMQ